jgi:hypothetical protein
MDSSEIQIQDNVSHQINAKLIIHLEVVHVMLIVLEIIKFAKIHVVQMAVPQIINALKAFYVLLDVVLYLFATEMMIAHVEMFVLEIVVLLQQINPDNAQLIPIVDEMESVLISNAV